MLSKRVQLNQTLRGEGLLRGWRDGKSLCLRKLPHGIQPMQLAALNINQNEHTQGIALSASMARCPVAATPRPLHLQCCEQAAGTQKRVSITLTKMLVRYGAATTTQPPSGCWAGGRRAAVSLPYPTHTQARIFTCLDRQVNSFSALGMFTLSPSSWRRPGGKHTGGPPPVANFGSSAITTSALLLPLLRQQSSDHKPHEASLNRYFQQQAAQLEEWQGQGQQQQSGWGLWTAVLRRPASHASGSMQQQARPHQGCPAAG